MISNKSFEDHIEKLDKVLSRIKSAGFKVNGEKLECLELRQTR